MFRVTISPIIRSMYSVYGQWWNKYNKMQQLRFLFTVALLYMFWAQSQPSSGVHMLYMANGGISPSNATIAFLFSAMTLLDMFRATISPIIRSTYAVYGQWWNKYNKMQQLRFIFAMDLLYIFLVTISAMIRSTYAVYDQWWNKSNKMQQLRFLFAMPLLNMFRVTMSPIIRSTYAVYGQWWNKYNKVQQLRFLFALALLYIFRMTI